MKKKYINAIEENNHKEDVDNSNVVETDVQNSLNSKEEKRKVKIKKMNEFIKKYIIPPIFVGYGMLFSRSFIGNINSRYVASIFMSFFSLFLALFYTGKMQNSIFEYLSKISNELYVMVPFMVSAVLTLVFSLIFFEVEALNKCPFLKENLGNLLTWLSITIFFLDKNQEIKNNKQ